MWNPFVIVEFVFMVRLGGVSESGIHGKLVTSNDVTQRSLTEMNMANSHKPRALGTISHKIYKKTQKCMELSEMYESLREVGKSQKCTVVSEIYFKPLLYLKTVQKVRQTDRQTDIVNYRVASTD